MVLRLCLVILRIRQDTVVGLHIAVSIKGLQSAREEERTVTREHIHRFL